MSKSQCGRLGWLAVVYKYFDNDEQLAKSCLADIGRATFYFDTRPLHAGKVLAKWRHIYPHLVMDTDKGPVPRLKRGIVF